MKKEQLILYLKISTPFILALFYFFLLFFRAERVAITDDARFYMDAAKSYSTYFERCSPLKKCFEKNHIDRYWRKNNEHPPFAKLLMASGYYFFHKKTGWLDEIRSLRIGISLFAAIVLLFLFSFTARAFSFHAAIFASLAFIFLPRTFFHARVATLDFAVLGTSFIFIYCYWRGFNSRFWAWMAGVAFGVALSTKLNAPFMLFPVLIHYFSVRFSQLKKNPLKTLFPTQFISMLVISLPLFFVMWPWLWHSTFSRFAAYVSFHAHHYGILMYYLGTIYSEPRPPWHAPYVMMVLTTPLVTLFFAHISLILYQWDKDHENLRPMLLVLICAFVSIAILMFLPAPFYSGVKLFQPFFPFLCIMAGVGIHTTLKNSTLLPLKLKYLPGFLFFIPVMFSMVSLRHDHLSYYNELAGGTKGALKYSMETQYYDLFYWELTQFFNERCENKICRVSFEPNPKEYRHTSRILKNSNYLTENFIFCSNNCDYFVLTHEYRWRNYPYLLRNSKRLDKVFSLKRQGVELLTVFKLNN